MLKYGYIVNVDFAGLIFPSFQFLDILGKDKLKEQTVREELSHWAGDLEPFSEAWQNYLPHKRTLGILCFKY